MSNTERDNLMAMMIDALARNRRAHDEPLGVITMRPHDDLSLTFRYTAPAFAWADPEAFALAKPEMMRRFAERLDQMHEAARLEDV